MLTCQRISWFAIIASPTAISEQLPLLSINSSLLMIFASFWTMTMLISLLKSTAGHNADNRHVDEVLAELAGLIEANCIPIDEMNVITDEEFRQEMLDVYEEYRLLRKEVRASPLNQGGIVRRWISPRKSACNR
jgi:hypothetical protein